ncbi:MAG: SUMF1/EgtB/PvdO family nonheme iron enzyme [Vicinamibacterales bacterium]
MPEIVRIFLSSPGDVGPEREQARQLLLGLARGPFVRGRLGIDVVSWDDPHGGAQMDARFTPQQAVDRSLPKPSDCDLTVVLLWSRMGTPLLEQKGDGTPYLSGTEWEFEEALRAGKPVFLYRRPVSRHLDPEHPRFTEDVEQWRRVKQFLNQFEGEGGTLLRSYATFDTPADLLGKLRNDVEKFLATKLDASAAGGHIDAGAASAHVTLESFPIRVVPAEPERLPEEPYPLHRPDDHPKTVAGRDADVRELASKVRLSPLVLLVHAASGAGKSSLLRAGLVPTLRRDGRLVCYEPSLGRPGLARRLANAVLELPASLELRDDDADTSAFAACMVHAARRSGRRVVLVLDQVDDVLRNEATRGEVLARLGPLMAATDQVGDQGEPPCTWLLCYRHEFHGNVRAWLRDVFADARTRGAVPPATPPYDMSGPVTSHDWVVPLMGRAIPGATPAEALRPFVDAITKPLQQTEDGRKRYPFEIAPDAAERLAAVFADERRKRLADPLVPELQVVLGHLVQRAKERAPGGGTPDIIPVDVPSDAELTDEIRHALARHLERALNDAFPAIRGSEAGRTARTCAILALRRLVDNEGRRAEPVPEDEVLRMLGDEGRTVLDGLASAQARLVVLQDGRCALSHDLLAQVVADLVVNEASRGNLTLDQRLIDFQVRISQKLAIHESDHHDESAYALTSGQRRLIADNKGTLLFDQARQAWWERCVEHQRRAERWRRYGLAAAVFVMGVMVAIGVWAYAGQSRVEEANRRRALETELVTKLAGHRLDFTSLVTLARVHRYDWREIPSREDEGFLKALQEGPAIVAAGPWSGTSVPPGDVLDVIERCYKLFVRSRQMFGAMSYAIEEVWLRNTDDGIRARASRLAGEVRREFLAYQLAEPGFELPPRLDADSLNAFVRIPPGRFTMGSSHGEPDEKEHDVSVDEFFMQQHEVTNQEYRRFDPSHKGEDRLPVRDVNWYDATAYASWLGGGLPTEAQWEYAARGSSGRAYPWGSETVDHDRASYGRTTPEPVQSHPKGRTRDTPLDDMAGSVWEWCRDWYEESYATPKSGALPLGPTTGVWRVLRGGSFNSPEFGLRAFGRNWDDPEFRYDDMGFRVVSSRLKP